MSILIAAWLALVWALTPLLPPWLVLLLVVAPFVAGYAIMAWLHWWMTLDEEGED